MAMNPADPKWLEILKANGWQTIALTVACILIVELIKKGIIPTTDSPLWIALPSIGALIFGFLSLASIASAAAKYIKPGVRIDQWRMRRRKIKEIIEYIPYMSDKDREIIGYLLYHKQKMFQADNDGGYAAPLISKGIIRVACKAGQTYDSRWTPFEIPDYAWSVLERNKEHFPYKPPAKGDVEKHPWAIHWMVR